MSWFPAFPYSCRKRGSSLPENLVFLAHYDSDFNDSGPHELTGTETTGASITTADQKFGAGCLLFDRTSGCRVDYSDNSDWDFGSNDFTVELWMRANHTGIGAPFAFPFIGHVDAPTTNGWIFYSRDPFGLIPEFRTYSSSSTIVQLSATTDVNDDTWHHLAVVRNGSTYTLYVDGTSEDTASSASAVPTSSANLSVGYFNGASFVAQGKIDEVAVWNGTAKYTSNFTPPTSAY